MAGRSAQTAVSVQQLRVVLSHLRAQRGRADVALLFAAALRARMRRMGAPSQWSSLEQPFLSSASCYALRVERREIPWSRVQPLLRAALEVDVPAKARSQEARDLADFLHAERPTRVQYILARKKLMEIWRNLNRN